MDYLGLDEEILKNMEMARKANIAVQNNNLDYAVGIFVKVLENCEARLGPYHPDTLNAVNSLAQLYTKQNKTDLAETFTRRALLGRINALAHDLNGTLRTLNNLGVLHKGLEMYEEAESYHIKALVGREKVLGPSHRDTLVTVSNLAHLYYDIGRYQEAEVLFERSLAGFENLLGASHPSTLGAMNNLANILKKRGQYKAARKLYRTAKAGLKQALGKEHEYTQISKNNLKDLKTKQGGIFGFFGKADENIALPSGHKGEPDAAFWEQEDDDDEEPGESNQETEIGGLESTLLEMKPEDRTEKKKYANDSKGRRRHIEDESTKVASIIDVVTQLSSLVHDEIKKRGFSEKEKQLMEEELDGLRKLVSDLQAALKAEKDRADLLEKTLKNEIRELKDSRDGLDKELKSSYVILDDTLALRRADEEEIARLKKDLAMAKSANPHSVAAFDWESVRILMKNIQQTKDKLDTDLATCALEYSVY